MHATREDPAPPLIDFGVLVTSVASLAGVVYLPAAGSSEHGAGRPLRRFAILSVAGAWAVLHSVFTLRSAFHYTGSPGGIDFSQSSVRVTSISPS